MTPMSDPLKVIVVEDEALLALELENLIEDAGHEVVGWATTLEELRQLMREKDADVAFVDLQLADGPTGIDVARHIRKADRSVVVFMTANPRWLPDDLAGAVGVIAKPYTMNGVREALRFLHEGIRRPPPAAACPTGFTLSPGYAEVWGWHAE
jgi:DNA-binding response OmpR family regulator